MVLEPHPPILHLIQKIGDKPHRFAVTFHRQRRSSRTLHSALVDIPGIGERTAEKLLRRFGSLARLREASLEELSRVVTRPPAQHIVPHPRRPTPPSARSRSMPPDKRA